ncbi:MAG: L,D-transpeptidase [Pseudomonadota bacterium]
MRQSRVVGMISVFVMALMGSQTAAFAEKNEPLHIIVSLKDQHLRVYQGTQEIAQSNISSGKRGNETPTGIFSVLQKNRHHRSNIYSNAPMPFMQRLTWSGIALHASNNVPDHPASHGCVRLPHEFARELFRMKTRGAHVIIEENAVTPQLISHDKLFQPKVTWKQNSEYDPWVNAHIEKSNTGFITAKSQEPVRVHITRRTHKEDLFEVQRLLNKLGFDAGTVDGYMGPVTWNAITEFQKAQGNKPNGKIDGQLLKSLYKKANEEKPANGRLLVRQGQLPIYEAQVTITNPELPLGSHLVSATGFDKSNQKTDWLHVSLEDRVHRRINLQKALEIEQTTSRRSVSEALDRVTMSAKVKSQVSRLLTSGSSITISDNGLSIETGAKATDFIVLTKPEHTTKFAEQVDPSSTISN